MGVPALFRWLSQRYPKIIENVKEEKQQEVCGETIPIDYLQPNPNGREFDNLYLDMNGIVHPCSHPEDRPPPASEEEMMRAIFEYTDRIMKMVRPRKLLMIAVDGVAPRAKMNQQRSRRFRSAQEAEEKDHDREELMKLIRRQSGRNDNSLSAEAPLKPTWDSNAITPGTPFMRLLADSLRYWCALKLNTDPLWAKLKVIISDASVPGEGEHKIMNFVRSQRTMPNYDPNTRHVIYGLDADLIMLGLATHEPHFHVLREDVFFQDTKPRACPLCGQEGHRANECRGDAVTAPKDDTLQTSAPSLKPYIWLHVGVLREYLAIEMFVANQPFRFDLERALDDWVFMCFFVGNDFLPHLPSLEIREDGIDRLLDIWRQNIPLMGGYVTKDGEVDLVRVQFILSGLAKQEDNIFRRRREVEERREENAKRRKTNGYHGQRTNNAKPISPAPHSFPEYDLHTLQLHASGFGESRPKLAAQNHQSVVNRPNPPDADYQNKAAAAALKEKFSAKRKHDQSSGEVMNQNTTNGFDAQPQSFSSTVPKPSSASDNQQNEAQVDEVRLWEAGYSDRYYASKFGVDAGNIPFRNKVAAAYVQGLCWVLSYYFQGVPSWTWYYPYHYAPFAADFVDVGQTRIEFEVGTPFRPYEQLMGVMPAASCHTLPPAFHSLMTDPTSVIADFYPRNFPIDLNGKKFAWQGVAILPFIDAKRLLDAMDTVYQDLTEDEKSRNVVGQSAILVSPSNKSIFDNLLSMYRQQVNFLDLGVDQEQYLGGRICKDPAFIPFTELRSHLGPDMPTLQRNTSMSALYEMPRSQYPHKSMLLRGVKLAGPLLTAAEIEATRYRSQRPAHRGRG